ncbi:MAG: restriction endonuclease subunit S [Myxococcales bacterium]|nr:restriction endonuclease subunit S [Myxococcales bacterium]
MGSEWKPTSLGEVADLLTGYPFKSQYYTQDKGDPRLVGGDNVVQGSLRWDNVRRWPREMVAGLESYWLAPGDVVLAMDRPWIDAGLKRAAIGVGDVPALLVQRTARLRGSERLDTGFLRYVTGSSSFVQYVLGVQTGTAVPHISPSQIRTYRFLLPPISEQRRIAAVLGALDDKIELNRKMNRTLEDMAQALFKSWFIDFDGHDDLVDSELGPVPRGWAVTHLLNVVRLLSGGTPKTSEASYWGGEVKWASAKDVSNCSGRYLVDTERSITTAGLEGSAAKLIPKGAVAVVARGATCGRWCLFGETVAMNQTCYAIVARRPEHETFIKHAVPPIIALLVQQAHGSVFDTITTSTFEAARLVVPPDSELNRLTTALEPLEDRILANVYESRTLTSLRDTLLPKLISGELRVPEAEQVIEEVLR